MKKISNFETRTPKNLDFHNLYGKILYGKVDPAWKMFVDCVENSKFDLVLVGTRSFCGPKSLFTDSFSQHCSKPTLVAPSPCYAEKEAAIKEKSVLS